ncbi:hypothetical protein BKA81DRAFT_204217 [Phyllosticta paracitricarpa]|uniref:Uncharacterized protein n=1 Tax=Phyllosticta paracitricarpa TaxID=2016321 RepID=A0ABR1NH32_9PEZI
MQPSSSTKSSSTMLRHAPGRCCAPNRSSSLSIQCIKSRRSLYLTCHKHQHSERFIRGQLEKADEKVRRDVVMGGSWMAPLREGDYTYLLPDGHHHRGRRQNADTTNSYDTFDEAGTSDLVPLGRFSSINTNTNTSSRNSRRPRRNNQQPLVTSIITMALEGALRSLSILQDYLQYAARVLEEESTT